MLVALVMALLVIGVSNAVAADGGALDAFGPLGDEAASTAGHFADLRAAAIAPGDARRFAPWTEAGGGAADVRLALFAVRAAERARAVWWIHRRTRARRRSVSIRNGRSIAKRLCGSS